MTSRVSGHDANSTIEGLLHDRLTTLERVTDGDVLAYFGPIVDEIHDLLRVAVDELDSDRRDKLVVVLETRGGYAESAERFQRLFRKNYPGGVDFIVPGFAMSAGTILVMSGDSIYMDYSSVLGPIDPRSAAQEKTTRSRRWATSRSTRP